MIKNKAGQSVNFLMLNSSGASVETGTPVVYITGDNGTQSTGAGTSTHKGNGSWAYIPTKAETNYDHISFLMELSGAISREVNIYTISQGDAANAVVPTSTQKNLGELRTELASRLGFGSVSSVALNQAILNSFLIRAQENIWRRIDHPRMFKQYDLWVAPGETGLAYPQYLDQERIHRVQVDYDGNGHWYPMHEGVDYAHDSVAEYETWPRRYERNADQLDFWPTIATLESETISAITKADPAVVTLDTAPTVALVAGMRIRIADVGGMTEIADGVYTVGTVNSTTSFNLHDSNDDAVDSTAYTTFTTGGTVSIGYKVRFEGIQKLGAFSADTDYTTLPEDLVLEYALVLGKAHYRHPDANAVAAEFSRRLMIIRGQVHGNRRYIPDKRGGGVGREVVRPLAVS